jgi:hypothetical protein
MRTVRTTSSDGPRATRAARTVRDVRADCPPNHFPPKATGQPDRNEGAEEHVKNTWAKMHHADCPHLSYGPPWAHYLGGYQDRLLGGPLGLPGLRYTAPDGVEHKDYGGEVLG